MDFDPSALLGKSPDSIDSRADFLCSACKKNEIDTSENRESKLCSDCRHTYLELKVPLWVTSFMAIILILIISSATLIPATFDDFKSYRNAQKFANQHKYAQSTTEYLTILGKYKSKKEIVLDALDSAIGAQNFEVAAYIFDTYLVGKRLTDEEYQRTVSISEFLSRFSNSIELCESVLKDADKAEDITTALLENIKRSDIDAAYLYFVIGRTNPDPEIRKQYLLISTQQNDRCTYPLAYYGNELRREGSYDKASEVYHRALVRNASDTYAMRGEGILMQINGDFAGGLEKIREAYDINPNELYINDALIIALCENGMREEATEFMEARFAEEYKFDQAFYDYMDGKVSMVKYYSQ